MSLISRIIERITEAGEIPISFLPTDLSGLVLWLDAADVSTIQPPTGPVASWADKSGNSNTATQFLSIPSQPAYIPASLGINPSLSFDGTDDFLKVINSPSLQWGDEVSFFIAYEIGNITLADIFFDKDVAGRIALETLPRISFFGGSPFTKIIESDFPQLFSTSDIMTVTKTAASARLRINGKNEISTFNNKILLNTSVDIGIGATSGGTSNLQVKISEIVVYNRSVTNGEVGQVETYLIDKYPVTFSPLDFSPELWLDSQDISTFIFNGSNISRWNDKSGNSNDAIQSTAIEQPLFVSGGLNGKPTVRSVHTGTALGLEISGGINIAANAPRTMFMVINPTAGFVSNEVFGKNTGNMIDFGTFRPPSDFNSPDRIRFRNTDSTLDVLSAQGTVTYGTPTIITVIDGSVADLNCWNINTQILNSQPRAFSWSMNINLGIGKSLNFGSRSYNGDISEIIIYPEELDTDKRLKVLAFLNSKWGL